jgi:selenocysteine-specific elongation factor
LAILDLLNVSRGVVVITKRDLVDEEIEELAVLDARQLIEGTALKDAPVVVVSAVTGEGLSDLLSTIDTLLDSTSLRRNIGKPRLSIDRVFTMRGFGTVVTGTLIDGMFSLGQEVEILPTGQRTYIRGLETHRRKIDAALPGSRVAINLTGISTDQLERGFVIQAPARQRGRFVCWIEKDFVLERVAGHR